MKIHTLLLTVCVVLLLSIGLGGCGAMGVVTTERFEQYQKAQEEKDDAIARATRAYANNAMDDAEHAAAVKLAQKAPGQVVEDAKNDPSPLDQWGDFGLALLTTLGVPAVFTGIGGVALDRIRNNRRRKRGEPVDTDGDGEPDATDSAPLDPNSGAKAPTES